MSESRSIRSGVFPQNKERERAHISQHASLTFHPQNLALKDSKMHSKIIDKTKALWSQQLKLKAENFNKGVSIFR
jgi:hypothetical protein